MIDNISSQNPLQTATLAAQQAETAAAAQAASTSAATQTAAAQTNAADYGSFASLLATQLATNATSKLNASDDDDDDGDSSYDLFSYGDATSLMTESLLTAALSGDSTSASSIFGEGTSTSDALLMLCMMLSSGSGSSDNEGGMSMMVASLAAALSKKTRYEQENLRLELLNSDTGQATKEYVNEALFGDTSEAAIPYNASKPVTPEIVSTVEERGAELYTQVVGQFEVESNPRYAVNKNGEDDTYCNIFLWDVTSAMGAEIPHYIDPDTNEPLSYSESDGAKHMNANRIYDWLDGYGQNYGWREATPEEAQRYANEGRPAITIWKNPTGGHGHAQVVVPSKDGAYNEATGVMIAQAGRNLYSYAPISKIYSSRLSDVKYYVHA